MLSDLYFVGNNWIISGRNFWCRLPTKTNQMLQTRLSYLCASI
ncbi:hypothetical protein HMPREF1555_01768 [Porphyromonas gingivalis F0570]|uniref:Uncharacterized protein n=1 Tax=Porphyromonas gingivalis F0570 TaxID=1227271 RepID=A0A0E2LNV5_PORGN|nr:hypothetical protein HMPREF1555_01768 [Porphyromonas gingivalis F0570]